MLKAARSYEEACRTFRWRIPDRYNLAFDLCDRQTMAGADGYRTALIAVAKDGSVERYTFLMLRHLSNRLCNVLTAMGVRRGDRVAVSIPPSVEAAVSLLAVPRMGAIAVPIPVGLDGSALNEMLARHHVSAALLGTDVAEFLGASVDRSQLIHGVLAIGGAGGKDFWGEIERGGDVFDPVVTLDTDPALLFPDPLTGKGALHAHRSVLGNLPASEFALDFFAQPGDVLWTSMDWMDFSGLMWAVFPAWHHGVPVVASARPFDPGHALALIAGHGVRAAVVDPLHLVDMTAEALRHPHGTLRAMAVAPDAMSMAVHDAVRRAFGTDVNEIWGSVATGAVAANNTRIMELHAGSPGRAVPGVTVEAVDLVAGQVLAAEQSGILAAAPRTPGAALGDEGWVASGWAGKRDLDGYIWPEARHGVPNAVSLPPPPKRKPPPLLAPTPDERW